MYIRCFFCLFLSGCALPKLSTVRQDVQENPIRLQGFYYNKPEYWDFVLYKNGIIRGDALSTQKSAQGIANYYSTFSGPADAPYFWGVFTIKDKSIAIERWESREWAEYAIVKYSGEILNDTTLLLSFAPRL